MVRLRKSDHAFAKDPRSSAELAEAALLCTDPEKRRRNIAILHYRGSQEEYELARTLAQSGDPKRRELGADILGELGWEDRTFPEESVQLLIDLLSDDDAAVRESAAYSLGFRNDSKAIPHLLPLIADPNTIVRRAVVHGLSRYDDDEAVAGLIRLVEDSDREVRDWATFGLGSLTELDSPAIREALLARASEDDAEIRGEALIGLARRQDRRARDLVAAELQEPFSGNWALEAAELLKDSSLYPLLVRSFAALDDDVPDRFRDDFRNAIEACRPK